MKATARLHDLGQSLWLDNITRELLTAGTLKRYIDELSVTGLTSNPTIFDHAIKNSTAYDAAIRRKLRGGQDGRGAVLRAGARGHHRGGRPVSTDLGEDSRRRRVGVAGGLTPFGLRHGQHNGRGRVPARARETVQPFHKDSGHAPGLAAVESAIVAGVPVNVTLLVLARAIHGSGRGVSARH